MSRKTKTALAFQTIFLTKRPIVRSELRFDGRSPMTDASKALKDFLRAESLKSPITQYCPACGSVMEYIIVKFFTGETDEIWDSPFPVCCKCVRSPGKSSFVNYPAPAKKRRSRGKAATLQGRSATNPW